VYRARVELDAALELLRRYAPLGLARPERVAGRFVAREGRSLAWRAAEQLDALLDAWSADREPQIVDELGDQHWRYEESPFGLSLEGWLRSMRVALWTVVLWSDTEGLLGSSRSGDAIGGDPESSGSREPRRPLPSPGSLAAAVEPPAPDEFTDAIGAAA
jgi:hypothetical protein